CRPCPQRASCSEPARSSQTSSAAWPRRGTGGPTFRTARGRPSAATAASSTSIPGTSTGREVQALRGALDPARAMTDELHPLRSEVDELQASRRRLVLSGDADRRRIERELHDGPQQHLVALAVNLQLALRLVDDDPEAAKQLIEQMGRDVHKALD